MKLSRFAVQRPVTMMMMIICIVVLGLISLFRIPVNLQPEVERPVLSVQAYMSSTSPEEIQKEITIPLEDVLSTTTRLDEMTSWSSQSSCRVSLHFTPGTEMNLASMEVRDKIDQAMSQLPKDLRRLYIQRYEPNDSPVIEAHISWDGPMYQLYEMVYEVLVRRLRRVDGVADVDIHGLNRREVMVDLDQNRLHAHNVDIVGLSQDIAANNQNVSGGHVYSGGRKYSVRTIGEYTNLDEIAETHIRGTELKLSDVADIKYGEPYHRWWSRLNGRDAVSLAVYRDTNENLMDVARNVRKALEEFQQEPGMESLDLKIYRDQSLDIRRSLEGLINAGLLGMLFACIVLYLFLRKVRSTLIILTAIPLSVISAFLFIYLSRQMAGSLVSINLVSLSGLMISVGMLLDNGVVVLENIYRHRQEQRTDARTAAISGSDEVAMPVLAATATTLIVFVPMFFIGSSWMSTSMKDFGIVVCVALLASLLVAFTLIPLLASRLFERVRTEQISSLALLIRIYERIIRWTLAHRAWIVLGSLVIMGISGWLFTKIERELQPRRPSRNISLRIEHPARYSDAELLSLFGALEDSLLNRQDDLDIESVSTSFGRPYSTSGVSRSSSSAWIRLKDLEDSRLQDPYQSIENVMNVLPVRPGVMYRRNYSRDEYGQEHVTTLEIQGHDIGIMSLYAEEVKRRLTDIEGVVNVETSLENGREEVALKVNREKAQKFGLTSRQIAQTMSSALGTRAASYYKTRRGEVRITVRLREEDRVALPELENMVMENAWGDMVPLSAVAEHTMERGPLNIERDERRNVVEIFITSIKPGRTWLMEQIEARLQSFHLPIGYKWELGHSYYDQKEMEQETIFAALLAIFLIYMILAALFESFIHPFTILLSVPFAMIGVLLMFIVTGVTLNSMSYLGIIILMGIVVNNGIILISYIIDLRASGLDRDTAIIRAGMIRLRPILMTASTTILGIAPMVLPLLFPTLYTGPSGVSGTYGPIASAVFGGLLTSTLLTLIITPTIYSLLEDAWDWCSRVILLLTR